VPNQGSAVEGGGQLFVFSQKPLCEDESVRRGVVMVKQPGLSSPKFGATSSYVSMRSLQNVAVEPGIHSLACWDKFFVLPQLLYRWHHHSGIFWIIPRDFTLNMQATGSVKTLVVFQHSTSFDKSILVV
jgi:hypothetical protein